MASCSSTLTEQICVDLYPRDLYVPICYGFQSYNSECEKFYYSAYQCANYFKDCYKDSFQEALESPMPWVGMYIAAASAGCTLAMAADVFNGFRKKKLWFPSKYFSLNAFSLTVLAVAMKLTVDLTTQMNGSNDRMAPASSLVLMSSAMTNFVASLGSMRNNEVMLNLAALGILVITIVANVCIRLYETLSSANFFNEEIGAMVCAVFLLPFLVILCSSSVMVSTAKVNIESRYNRIHKRILNERLNLNEEFTALSEAVKKYWVMSETGGPQFLIARSVVCVTSDMMCLSLSITLLVWLILTEEGFTSSFEDDDSTPTLSSYKWSIYCILYIQSIGVLVGTIPPLLRWFSAAKLKSTKLGQKSFKEEFKVEAYWTQWLRDGRDSPLPFENRHLKFRKTLHDAKRLLLNFCIAVQILIVRVSKLLLFISAVFVKAVMFFPDHVKDILKKRDSSESSNSDDLNDYMLHLDEEPELSKGTLKNICSEVDKLIQMSEKKQPKKLIQLLQKSMNFNGVREFDSREIQSLYSQELPNCWSLPVVTLTSIAISLPNITDHNTEQLVMAVGEGLRFTQLIGKTLDSNVELVSLRKAANVVWLGIELYKRWQGNDLNAAELRGRTHKETLQNLRAIAEKIVTDIMPSTLNSLLQDPLNWTPEVIAATSMYRITQTILLSHNDYQPETSEELFERLSVMISEILAACLTNIGRVISLSCHSNAIEEREESIRKAAILLGESEEILEILQQRELPNLDPETAAGIDGWRAALMV